MSNEPSQSTVERMFQKYYDEVGQYALISATEERALLERYRRCPSCLRKIPEKIKQRLCLKCGEPAPARVKSRLVTCGKCEVKYDAQRIPSYCPQCGSDRDFAARDQLVTANLRFVVKAAKAFTRDQERLLNLISAGNVGLMVAVDKFDLRKETRFLTYAAWWVRKEMLDEINSSGIVHVPSHKQKEHRKLIKHGEYVCNKCDLRLDSLNSVDANGVCDDGLNHSLIPVYADQTLNAVFSIDKINVPDDNDLEQDAIDGDASVVLRTSINKLPLRERDKFIILQYYNIAETARRSSGKSLHQLAEIAGITPERVRQIKERTLKDLRTELKRNSIKRMDDMCT